jgi:hypothetical protein
VVSVLGYGIRINTKNLLVIDYCSYHKITAVLTHIEIVFLPPNLTSKLQPLDQGIIKCVKTFFNNQKLNEIIEKIEAEWIHFLLIKI